MVCSSVLLRIIAELAERRPITIQNSSNPSSPKNLVVRPYDRTTVRPYDRTTVRPYDRATVQGATFNMRGQLYHGHYLSHNVMEGRGYHISVRQETPSDDDKVRILERRAAV